METVPQACPWGTRKVIRLAVQAPEDWERLEVLDPLKGQLGMVCDALGLTADELSGRVPLLQTVFSPLTTAFKLAGDRLFEDLRRHPETVGAAWRSSRRPPSLSPRPHWSVAPTASFSQRSARTAASSPTPIYERFGRPYDLQVLEGFGAAARMSLLHIHGDDTLFDMLASYPVQLLNWHDRITVPSLAEGLARFPGAVIGGIDEAGPLLTGSAAAVRQHLGEALDSAGPRRLGIGPGCSLVLATPEANIKTVLEMIRAGI